MSWHTQISIHDFSHCCEQDLSINDYPLADTVEKNVLCYSSGIFEQAMHDTTVKTQLSEEISHNLMYGSGVLAIHGAYTDPALLERHNQRFDHIIDETSDTSAGDHFAKAGTNGRIWNALQKIALTDPEAFCDYYANPVLQIVSQAWLGPHYQMTSQVNIVRPGGDAQQPHRDYHLGFQSSEVLTQYPSHVHTLSPILTLQGAVAHSDMPIESGPTLLLPFSQQYPQGYLAWRETEFIDYFTQHAIQLPLSQGDAVFFNPALFHAAGKNHTRSFHRIANLLQVSSAFGRAMETVDRYAISSAIYPTLLEKYAQYSPSEQDALLSTACEGYSFPSNLDRDPPVGGMAPETHRQLTERALAQGLSLAAYQAAISTHQTRRET